MNQKPEGVTDKAWARFLNETAEITFEFRMVTVDEAREALEVNGKNRNISGGTVVFYADQIRVDEWLITGQPVIYGRNGKLLDGQHRYSAIIQADRAAPLLIVRGVPDNAFEAIDRGRSRTIGDIFQIAGEASTLELAAACRFLSSFRQNGRFGKQWGRVSFTRVKAILKKNPGLRSSVRFAGLHKYDFPFGSASLLATLHYLLSEVAAEDAAYFFDGLFTGADLFAGHPILQLRNLILKNRSTAAKYPKEEIGRFVLKAWKMFCAGEKGSLRVVDHEDLTVIAVPTVPLAERYK